MNVLLTGGTGYIGSHTAVVLIEAGFNVVLLDNLSNSQRDVFDRLEKITSTKITFIEGDVRDKPLVSSIFRAHKIDAVVHFAGLKAVGESVADPLKYYDNNVVGTIRLLEAMQENNVKRMVFSSSATVYGEPQYLPYDEGHPTNPINPYGRTKLHIEELLRDLAVADSDWSIMCLRYFNPVGAHDSGLIGEDPKGVPNNLMPYILDVAAGKRPYIRIFGDDYSTPDGTGVRDYIHVMDLADGHKCALTALNQEKGWNVVNIGTGFGLSVLEFIGIFSRANNLEIPYRIEGRRHGDLPSYYAGVKKAQIILGWSSRRSIDLACKSAWGWRK